MILNENKYSGKEAIGQIFTPNYITKFMVNNVLKFLGDIKKKPCDLKVLEPSVGEGIFLKYLITNNFFDISAYEIDKNLKPHLLILYPSVDFKFENVLGSNLNEQFDLIVGNPPYLGQNYNAEIFQQYIEKFPICKKYFVGNMDLFYYFIHLGILKLRPGGILSFITTNYWITKSEKTGIKLLKPHIIDECFLLQYIELSDLKIFKGAEGQHNCIFVLQKKTKQDKQKNLDKDIEIIQIRKKIDPNQSDELFNKKVFMDLIQDADSNNILKYKSALTNRDLEREGSWNLLYPQEVKEVIDKIEKYCSINEKVSFLKDYFIIRNGLIFIKDNIFILNIGDNLKIENNDYFIKVNNKFLQLSDVEKKRLKKIYKSKSIKPYGYNQNENIGYAIYFNKQEFQFEDITKRNQLYDKKYPILTAYLKQFEKELREILINAKENPNDFYFPRRGTFIRRFEEKNNKEKLVDLEPLYDKGNKLFFKYISNVNIFSYTNSSYLATSDTYFLWPKYSKDFLDYPFILAYLNSKLVYFLFKAKNIYIKRSKTKLECGIPIPNFYELFDHDNKTSELHYPIIDLIKILSSILIELNHHTDKLSEEAYLKYFQDRIHSTSYFKHYNEHDFFMSTILTSIENKDKKFIQKTIDKLIFRLFDIREKEIDYLLNRYY